LSTDRSWTITGNNSITLGTPNGLSLSTQVLSLGLASASTNGALSSTDWTTFNNKQNTITLTTTGNSGAATLVSNTLNIPNYTLTGLGGQPLDGDLTAIAALTGATGLLRKTAINTWSLDTNTYLTSVPLATSTINGIRKLFSDTVQMVASNAVTATASRTYGVQVNASSQLVINVPWVNTTYLGSTSIILNAGAFERAALTGDITSSQNILVGRQDWDLAQRARKVRCCRGADFVLMFFSQLAMPSFKGD
jgi:hypothetical protein